MCVCVCVLFCQVIFDLGHVMFTNVTDWSTPQPITLLADDSVENVEDDGTLCVCVGDDGTLCVFRR